jgi:DNA polymerase-3 subunit delta'
MRFADIRDQDVPLDIFRRAITTDKVPHAYLFQGPAGVGKSITAGALAMIMNCDEPGEDSCGVCTNCRKIIGGVHPDVRFLGLPEGKRRIPIEMVRNVQGWMDIRPHEGKAKVLIIDPADLLTEQASNALLKTLEEPRTGSLIILISDHASSLLPTIRSRCQSVRFGALEESTVVDLLQKKGLDSEKSVVVASLSAGSMERASRYTGEDLAQRMQSVTSLLRSATDDTPEDAMAIAAALKGDRDETLAVLELMLQVLDELLWLRSNPSGEMVSQSALVRFFGELLEGLTEKGSPGRVAKYVAAVHRAITAMNRNNMNPQLAVEGMVMAMRGRTSGGEAWGRIGAR